MLQWPEHNFRTNRSLTHKHKHTNASEKRVDSTKCSKADMLVGGAQLNQFQMKALNQIKSTAVDETFLKKHQSTLAQLRARPVAIQFDGLKTFHHLCHDTHYRNMFETSTTGGSKSRETRLTWEKRMFHGAYTHAVAQDRIKYGYLRDAQADPNFVYGDCLLILKEHVKERCTATLGDSSHASIMPHKLSETHSLLHDTQCHYDDQTGWKMNLGHYDYIEVQIHGPVLLKQDVDTLILHTGYQQYQSIVAKAKSFARRNKCELRFEKLR
jgi:hypothetical protein